MTTISGKPKGYFEKILCLDCESTGLCFGSDDPSYNPNTGERHQAVSWGVVVADAHTLKPIEDLYVEIQWNDDSIAMKKKTPNFGTYAEKIHGLSRSYLETNGVTEEDAVLQIGELVIKYFADGNIRALGHNVNFDICFLRQMFRKFDIELKFGGRMYDTNSMGWNNFETYNSDQLFEECGFPKRKDHNALTDAKQALEAARIMRIIFQSALK